MFSTAYYYDILAQMRLILRKMGMTLDGESGHASKTLSAKVNYKSTYVADENSSRVSYDGNIFSPAATFARERFNQTSEACASMRVTFTYCVDGA